MHRVCAVLFLMCKAFLAIIQMMFLFKRQMCSKNERGPMTWIRVKFRRC